MSERFESEAYKLMRRARALSRRMDVVVDRAQRERAEKAIAAFEEKGDLNPLRAWIAEAEWKTTLLHRVECQCEICRNRKGETTK